jgi:hypothetical protein
MEHFFEKPGRTQLKGDAMFVKTQKIFNKKHVTQLNKHGFYLTKSEKKPLSSSELVTGLPPCELVRQEAKWKNL